MSSKLTFVCFAVHGNLLRCVPHVQHELCVQHDHLMQHDILLRSIDNYGFEVAVDSFVDCVTAVGLKRVKACLFTVIRKLTLKCDCKYSPNLSTSCNKTMQ